MEWRGGRMSKVEGVGSDGGGEVGVVVIVVWCGEDGMVWEGGVWYKWVLGSRVLFFW